MAINPIVYTEKIVRSFLKYQLSAYPFADPRLHAQMRKLLSIDQVRRTPLLHGPYISLSRGFREGARVPSERGPCADAAAGRVKAPRPDTDDL